jgi:hypothetical protein
VLTNAKWWLTFAPHFATLTHFTLKHHFPLMAKRLLMSNWALGFVFLFLSSFSAFGQLAGNLYFSEYVEGSSNNRILEIYNGVGFDVDLSNYEIRSHANGTTGTTATLTLSGTLPNGKVIVIKNSSASIGPTAAANGNLYLSTTNGVVTYNGDDAISLWDKTITSNVIMIDLIGNIGCDPGTGWSSGSHSTLDKTLRRKPPVCFGVTTDPTNTSCPFPTITSEWDVFNIDTYVYGHLGCAIPEINVKQATTSLASGTGTYTFASRAIGSSSAAVTFTIENTGGSTLNITGTPKIAISGHTGDFSIVQTSTTATVAAPGTTTFTVTFTPSTSGVRTAVISIANDDYDEGTYTFTVTGTGNLVASPEIGVYRGAAALASGSGTYTFSPSVNVGSSSAAVTFTVENTGNLALFLTGTPKVAISGHTSDFTINETGTLSNVPATTGTTTFTIAFNPTTAGTRTAVISIDNDDSDENPYTFTVTGTGVAITPTLSVSPTSYAFGTLTNGTTNNTSYVVTASNLTAGVSVSSNNTQYTVSSAVGGPFASTASLGTSGGTVYVRFIPTGGAANVTISNTSTTASANYTATGTGIPVCVAPNQATSLNLTPAANSVDGTFTAASGGASAYLVVASTSSTLSAAPSTGVLYTAGNSLGGGTVVDGASGTTFTASSLTPSTQYYFFVFAYNNTSCSGGPVYRTPALSTNTITLAAPINIATYTFTGADGNETTWPADATPTGVSASTFARGGIASAPSTASGTNTFISTNFQTSGGTLATNRYVEFTVSPTPGYTLTLTDFSFQDQISGTGPTGFALRSSKDSYAANIFSGSTNATITDPAHVTTLTGFTTLSAGTTFRIYAYGASNASGTWRVDNVIIKGFINAGPPTLVVNPTSLAFGNVNINATSTQQSFTVTGYNLTNDVVLSVPAGYQFSTTSGSGYTSSNITLTAAQATAVDTIYVVFKPTVATTYPASITMTSTGVTTPPSVALTGTGVTPPPTITASVTSLPSFGNVDVNTTSAEQSYTVSAVDLTAPLLVNITGSYAMSTVSGGPYSTSQISFTPTSGTVTSKTIYVVFKPIANGSAAGNISNASTGATTRNVTLSGTGVTQCVAPLNQATNLTFPSIVGTTINGSFTASVGGADGYLVLRSTSSTLSTGPVDGVSYAPGATLGGGTVVSNTSATTFAASGNPTTQYYFFVYAFNNVGCVNGPVYKKPLLSGNATTLTALYTAFDIFDRTAGNTAGVPSSGGATAWTEVEGAAARVGIFNNKLVISGGSPAGADAASFNMTGKYATTFNQAQTDLVWIFNMASTRSNPSGFISTSSTFGTAMVLGGTDADITDAGNGYAVILGNSSSPDYVKIVRYTGGLMNPTNNANLTDIVSYTANSADQEILNVKVEYSPTTKIWKLYVNEPGGTASYNTGGTQPAFAFPDPTAATYATPASSSADNNALLNGALPHSGFLFNHGTAADEYATFDNFNIPTAQPCQNTWTGAVSTNWFTAGNWNCGVVPTATDDVVITNVSSTTNRFPVINAALSTTANVNDLTINAGASVTITANFIAGFPVSTNDLEIYGNLTNNGSTNWGTGTVTLKGSSAQTVSGNNNFQYLTIDNAAGVSLSSGTQKVYGTLALKAGALTTNGRLTIGSDATYTGLIDEFTTGYNGSIIGNITVERYSNNTASSFFYLGSPVGGAQVSEWADDFSLGAINGASNGSQVQPTSTCSITNLQAGSPYGGLFDYRENAITFCNLQGWHVRTSGLAPAGQGFLARTPAGTTIDVTGTFVTGTVTTAALSKTNNTSPSPKGMNLLANPYAAPIEWLAVASGNNTKVLGTAYFYQTSGPLAGTYVPVNSTTGGGEIGSSQSFFVEAVSNGVTVNFTNTMKRNGTNRYLRTTPVYEQMLTLDVTGNGFADRTMVAFGADFTPAFDSDFDARKLMSKPEQPSMYVNDGSLNYSIYAQPSVDQVQLVPVDFTAGTNGTFTIAADLSTFDPTAMVYLEDRLLGTMTNLRLASSYTFTSSTTDAANRFVLHFYPGMTVATEDASCAGVDGTITFEQPGATEWKLELIDVNGNTIYNNNNFNGNFTVSNLLPSIYTLNLQHASGYTISKLYLVNGPAPISVNFTAPATATEGDAITFTSATANASTYSWNFGDGSTSTDANPVHTFAYAGTYLVELVVSNGTCQESFTQLVTVSEKLVNGLDNVLDGKVSIYAYGTDINIELRNLVDISIVDVYDLTGRKVMATTMLQFVNGSFVISMENAANGYYFVRLVNGQDTKTEKVFVNSGK